MQLTESSIYVNLKRLRRMLYSCQFRMQKANRIIYGTPLMEASGEAMGNFVLAFLVTDDKKMYMDRCIGWFTRLRVDLEFCIEENIIQFPHRKPEKDKNGKEVPFADPRDAVNSQKIEIFRLVAKIDGDMCKWRTSLAKGKTLYAATK